ncbi:uncharacterized protein TNCV_4827341 [Trichonephila clavipes]|nr:uncharacterized protein TNCV_4827341 [Trichonephila clavipes]
MVADEAVGGTRVFLMMWWSSRRLVCRGHPEPGFHLKDISRIHWSQHLLATRSGGLIDELLTQLTTPASIMPMILPPLKLRQQLILFSKTANLISYNGAEIIKLDVWKRKRHFKVYGCYSPPGNTKLDFSLLTLPVKTILCGDFNAHSKRWNYSDLNSAGRVMEDLLIADQMELFVW